MNDVLFENNWGCEIKNASITNNAQTGAGGDVDLNPLHGFDGTRSTIEFTAFSEAGDYPGTGNGTNIDADNVIIGYTNPATYNFRLTLQSQLIDQASKAYAADVPGGVDLDFLPRQVHKGRGGIWGFTDMGAYEVQQRGARIRGATSMEAREMLASTPVLVIFGVGPGNGRGFARGQGSEPVAPARPRTQCRPGSRDRPLWVRGAPRREEGATPAAFAGAAGILNCRLTRGAASG
ncbi:MAG: hypothetical protein AB1486_07095 [Planctomycetota bacterium]